MDIKLMSRRDFAPEDINTAWRRASGRCECTRTSHGHNPRCTRTLDPKNRGRDGPGAWEVNHKDGNSSNNAPSNCEILCWPCHRETRSFGR